MNKVINALERAIQAEPDSLAAEIELAKLDGWDSMGMVAFIEELDESCGVQVSVDDVVECQTVQQLIDKIEDMS